MRTVWIRTAEVTIERARDLLALSRAIEVPVWILWYRAFKGAGKPLGKYETGELVAVTGKRVKIKLDTGRVHTISPEACHFVRKQEVG